MKFSTWLRGPLPANDLFRPALNRVLFVLLLFIAAFNWAKATVPSTTAYAQFLLTSNPQTLTVPFVFTNSSDLLVLDSKASPPVTLTQNSDYSVSGGAGSTGTVTTIAGGANGVQVGDTITISRNVPITQTTSFTNTGPLTASMIGQAFDKAAEISQQINLRGLNALQFQTDEVISGILPKSLRLGKYLAFDSNGNVVFLAGTGSTSADASLSNVTATGSTTPRDLAVRFADIVNVRDFGAVGNGSTNDTAAINAAIARAIQNANPYLYFPPGVYSTDGINITAAGFTMVGAGRDKTSIKASAACTNTITLTGSNLQYIHFADFEIDGSAGNGVGIYYGSTSGFLYNSVFERLYVHNHASHGIYIKNAFANTWRDIYSGNNLGDQFRFWGHQTDLFERLDIGSSQAAHCGLRIIKGGTVLSCNGQYANANGEWGIFGGDGTAGSDSLTAYPAMVIKGCNIEEWTGAGIEFVANPTFVKIEQCNFLATANTVSAVFLNFSTSGIPVYMDTCNFQVAGGAAWANGYPLHAQDGGGRIFALGLTEGFAATRLIWNNAGAATTPMVQLRTGSLDSRANGNNSFPALLEGATQIQSLVFANVGNPQSGSAPDTSAWAFAHTMPGSGTWVAGDKVWATGTQAQQGSGGSKYVIIGWHRLTSGSGNVLNTDWVEMHTLTGN